MKRAQRTRAPAVLVAAILLLYAADLVPVSAGSMRGGEPAPDDSGGRPILLSVKIHGAKKRDRKVAFYKSVARQRKARAAGAATRQGAGEPEGNRGTIGGPSSPSGR
jgi:hypothetical protein